MYSVIIKLVDKKICVLKNELVSLSFLRQILNFLSFIPKKTSISTVWFGESIELQSWREERNLPARLFNLLLNLQWTKVIAKHQSKIEKLSSKTLIVRNFWTLNETATLKLNIHTAKGKSSSRYKPEVNRAGVSTYGTTVPELSIALCPIWDCLAASSDREWL